MTTTETIIAAIYEVKKKGYQPIKIVMPFRTQKKVAYELLPSRKGEEGLIRRDDIELIERNGLIQFYGLPVEDGKNLSVEYESQNH